MTVDKAADKMKHLKYKALQGAIIVHDTYSDDYELLNESALTALDMAIASLEAWEKVKAEIEDYMERKWEQLSDSDKVIVTGVTTIDDWKFHMAESTLDIIDKHLQKVGDSQ